MYFLTAYRSYPLRDNKLFRIKVYYSDEGGWDFNYENQNPGGGFSSRKKATLLPDRDSVVHLYGLLCQDARYSNFAMETNIYSLFDTYFELVDKTFFAFSHEQEVYGDSWTEEMSRVAHDLKDERTQAACNLMEALAEMGIHGIAEGIQTYYKKAHNE